MAEVSALSSGAFVRGYDSLARAEHVVDVAGGTGSLALAVAAAHVRCKITVFDLPEVGPRRAPWPRAAPSLLLCVAQRLARLP